MVYAGLGVGALALTVLFGSAAVEAKDLAQDMGQGLHDQETNCVLAGAGAEPQCSGDRAQGALKAPVGPQQRFEEDAGPIVPRLYRSESQSGGIHQN